MGRNAKPASLHIAEGNPNRLTKEELAARQAGEVKLGKHELDKLKKPSFVIKNKVANKLWGELIKDYKAAAEQGIQLLTSSDVSVFAMYCKTYSEYENLLEAYQRIQSIAAECEPLQKYMGDQDEYVRKAMLQLNSLISIDGMLRIESAINKKADMLLKMQDRLFLNPLAKVKNVPKPKKDEKPTSKWAKFGGGRGG